MTKGLRKKSTFMPTKLTENIQVNQKTSTHSIELFQKCKTPIDQIRLNVPPKTKR